MWVCHKLTLLCWYMFPLYWILRVPPPHHDWMFNLVKCSFNIYWDDYVIFLFFIFIFGSIIYIIKTVYWHKFQTYKLAESFLQRDNGRIRENTSCSKYYLTFWNMIYFLDSSQAITIGKYFKWEKWSGCY